MLVGNQQMRALGGLTLDDLNRALGRLIRARGHSAGATRPKSGSPPREQT